MSAADLPPKMQTMIVCSVSAAVKYQIPVNALLAVVDKERGNPGQWVKNKNGTFDVGPLQFNTSYLKSLQQYGITTKDVEGHNDSCYPYDLAAWRIRGHILNDTGDFWQKVANYHSRTPKFNKIYRTDLIVKGKKWADWLDERFVTYESAAQESGQVTTTFSISGVTPRNENQEQKQTLAKSAGYAFSETYTPRTISFK